MIEQTEQQDELLMLAEVAHLLRVRDITVRRWIERGAISAIALPHARKRTTYRIRRSVVIGILSKQEEA